MMYSIVQLLFGPILYLFFAAQRLYSASQLFRFEPLLARGTSRLRRLAPPRLLRRLRDEIDEALTRGFTVARLGAMLAAVDEEHAIGSDAACGEHQQPLFHVGRER